MSRPKNNEYDPFNGSLRRTSLEDSFKYEHAESHRRAEPIGAILEVSDASNPFGDGRRRRRGTIRGRRLA